MDEVQKDYEAFFPVICKGDQVTSINVGDFVAVVPGRDYGVIHLYGKEYMLCTLYDVDYAVTADYAKAHDTYEKERAAANTNINQTLAKAKIDSSIFKGNEKKSTGVAIINKNN